MKWQAVFWDFDGVVLDSVKAKTKAFACMFRKYGPDIEQAVVDYHNANGGVSRFEKFRYYYNVLLNQSIDEVTLAKLGEEFSSIALKEVIASPFIPGAYETLQMLVEEKVPSFIVSGTPEEEVQFIVKERQLTPFFREVHGSPRKKTVILSEILERKGYEPNNCLFLGDAMTDYEAAKHNDIHFIGIVKDGMNSPFPEGTCHSTSVYLK